MSGSVDSWQAAVSGNWSNPANWSTGTVPNAVATAISVAGSYTVTLDVNASVSSLTLSDSGATLLLQNNLTVTGSSRIAAGTINIAGADAALGLAGNTTLNNVTIDIGAGNPGAFLRSNENGGAAVLILGANAAIVQTGMYATIESSYGAGDGMVNNGTITAAYAGGYFNIDGNSFTNRGSILVGNNEELIANGANAFDTNTSFINAKPGAITVAAGSNLVVSTHNFTNAGSIAIGAGGSLILQNTARIANGGRVSFASGATLVLSNLTLGTAQLLSFDSGSPEVIFEYGAVLNNAGASLAVGSGTAIGGITLDNATLKGGSVTDQAYGLMLNDATLMGVTFIGTLDLAGAGTSATVANGINFKHDSSGGSAVVNLSGASFTLNIDGSTTLNNATINFGGNYGQTDTIQSAETTGAAVLTLGSTLVLLQAGTSAVIGDARGGADALVNNGIIDADVSGGTLFVTGNHFINHNSVAVTNNATLAIESTSFTNTGSVTIDGSKLIIYGILNGGGSMLLDASATLETNIVAAGAQISFNGAATLELFNPTDTHGVIENFVAGDVITLQGVNYSSYSYGNGDLLVQLAGGGTATLDIPGSASASSFTLTNVTGGVLITHG